MIKCGAGPKMIGRDGWVGLVGWSTDGGRGFVLHHSCWKGRIYDDIISIVTLINLS